MRGVYRRDAEGAEKPLKTTHREGAKVAKKTNNCKYPSFPQRRESIFYIEIPCSWISASAGMTMGF